MPDLFSPLTLKGVTLRNRIAMSPMTMYRSVDGKLNDYHTMYLGARAAGGFGLIFAEQVAIAPEGRTSVHCAGIYADDQIESHAQTTAMIRAMGGVAGIQLGHTGRNGSEVPPWEGGGQLPADHPDGWQVVGPSAVPYGAPRRPYPVHALPWPRSRPSTASTPTRPGGRPRPATNGWRCTTPTAISGQASSSRWPPAHRPSMAAAWRTGPGSTSRPWTLSAPCGRRSTH